MKFLNTLQHLADLILRQRRQLRRFYQKVQHGLHWLLLLRVNGRQVLILMLALDHVLAVGSGYGKHGKHGIQLPIRKQETPHVSVGI